jgi:hypothetical protein
MAQVTELQAVGCPGVIHSFVAKAAAAQAIIVTLSSDSFIGSVVVRDSRLLSGSVLERNSFIGSTIERYSGK